MRGRFQTSTSLLKCGGRRADRCSQPFRQRRLLSSNNCALLHQRCVCANGTRGFTSARMLSYPSGTRTLVSMDWEPYIEVSSLHVAPHATPPEFTNTPPHRYPAHCLRMHPTWLARPRRHLSMLPLPAALLSHCRSRPRPSLILPCLPCLICYHSHDHPADAPIDLFVWTVPVYHPPMF